MHTTSLWIRESVQLSFRLIRRQFAPLMVLFVVTSSFDLWTEDAMQLAKDAHDVQRVDLQILAGVSDLVAGIVLLLVLSWGIPKVRALDPAKFISQPFVSPYLGSFFAEYFRYLAQTLLYGLLFIVPGFYRYCQLVFVPMIAIFSRQYREGNLDALKASTALSRGRMWQIFLTLAATTLLGVAFEFLPQLIPDLHTLPVRIFCALATDLISIWTFSLFFLLFESAILQQPLEGV